MQEVLFIMSKIKTMDWIYLSPHLDDVIYSCGGLIWEQVHSGDQVSVWTFFSGDPEYLPLSPFANRLHRRWGIDGYSLDKRRQEDLRACNRLGVSARHHKFQEAIYRVRSRDNAYLYPTEDSIFGVVDEEDAGLIHELGSLIAESVPTNAAIVFPLALGGHIDHVIIQQISVQLDNTQYFYADFPYVLTELDTHGVADERDINVKHIPLSANAISVWIDTIRDYESQFSSFWSMDAELQRDVNLLINKWSGMLLWKQNRT